MEQLDIDTEESCKQRHRQDSGMSFDRAEVEEKGLINMPDCPGKFQQIREQVDAGKLTITQASPEQMAQWRREREERRRVRSARRKRF